MCIFVYIHIHMYACKYKYAYIKTYICIHIYTKTHIYIYIYYTIFLKHLYVENASKFVERIQVLTHGSDFVIYVYIYINNCKYIHKHLHTQPTHTYAHKTKSIYLQMHIHNYTTLPYTYIAISSKPPQKNSAKNSTWKSKMNPSPLIHIHHHVEYGFKKQLHPIRVQPPSNKTTHIAIPSKASTSMTAASPHVTPLIRTVFVLTPPHIIFEQSVCV